MTACSSSDTVTLGLCVLLLTKSPAFQIEPGVFKVLPNLRVFYAVAKSVDYAKVDKAGIDGFLEEAWASAREEVSKCANVQSHPSIALWRKAFQTMNVSTKKYVTSVESMAKRAAKADSKPFSINSLVDFYNAFSLKYLLPFGGFDLASRFTANLKLRASQKIDVFTPLDSDQQVTLAQGEVIYASGNTVVTRHINWRQSKDGLMIAESTDVCFMAEILEGYPKKSVDALKVEFVHFCQKLVGVAPEVKILDCHNKSL